MFGETSTGLYAVVRILFMTQRGGAHLHAAREMGKRKEAACKGRNYYGAPKETYREGGGAKVKH